MTIAPIAQTFIVPRNLSSDTDIFISKVNVYFAKKSRFNRGVTVQIREVENGMPTPRVVPFSSVYVAASGIQATNTLALKVISPTTFEFDAPVALKTGLEYAIVVIADANDPDIVTWVSALGQADVNTGRAVRKDTASGVLFTSSNGRTWTPHQNENLKYDIFAAKFTPQTASVTLKNNGNEFLEIEDVSGSFVSNEQVFISSTTYGGGTVTITDESTVITGSGTSFESTFSQNQHIVVKSGTTYEVLKIKQIESATRMIAYEPSGTTATVSTYFKSPVGQVQWFTLRQPATLVLEDSTASSSGFKFASGDVVIGETSGASATITKVANLPISYIQPNIQRTNFSKTRLTMTADLSYGTSETELAGSKTKSLQFGSTNHLTDSKYYIRSKSNTIGQSLSGLGYDGLQLNFTLQATTADGKRDTSPVIDHEISTVIVGSYYINNLASDDATEMTSSGDAYAKYVSRKVELADGLDAEDIRVLLTAYKPSGTNVHVYAKFQSATDDRNFADIEWTRLYLKPNTNVISSLADRFDYRELDYYLGTTPLGANEGAWSDNGSIKYIDGSTTYYDYKYFAIKIVLLSTGHHVVPRLKDMRAIALS